MNWMDFGLGFISASLVMLLLVLVAIQHDYEDTHK